MCFINILQSSRFIFSIFGHHCNINWPRLDVPRFPIFVINILYLCVIGSSNNAKLIVNWQQNMFIILHNISHIHRTFKIHSNCLLANFVYYKYCFLMVVRLKPIWSSKWCCKLTRKFWFTFRVEQIQQQQPVI